MKMRPFWDRSLWTQAETLTFLSRLSTPCLILICSGEQGQRNSGVSTRARKPASALYYFLGISAHLLVLGLVLWLLQDDLLGILEPLGVVAGLESFLLLLLLLLFPLLDLSIVELLGLLEARTGDGGEAIGVGCDGLLARSRLSSGCLLDVEGRLGALREQGAQGSRVRLLLGTVTGLVGAGGLVNVEVEALAGGCRLVARDVKRLGGVGESVFDARHRGGREARDASSQRNGEGWSRV